MNLFLRCSVEYKDNCFSLLMQIIYRKYSEHFGKKNIQRGFIILILLAYLKTTFLIGLLRYNLHTINFTH